MLIPKSILCIRKFTDVESSRFAFGGVKFERNLATSCPRAIATDGRRLIIAEWEEDDPANFPAPLDFNLSPQADYGVIVPTGELDKISVTKLPNKKTLKEKPYLANVALSEVGTNGVVPIATTDSESTQLFNPRPVEGRFPRYNDVLTLPARPISVEVNAEFLADAALCVNKIAGCEKNGVILTLNADDPCNSLVLISAANAKSRAIAGVMPLSTEQRKQILPAWHNSGIPADLEPFTAQSQDSREMELKASKIALEFAVMKENLTRALEREKALIEQVAASQQPSPPDSSGETRERELLEKIATLESNSISAQLQLGELEKSHAALQAETQATIALNGRLGHRILQQADEIVTLQQRNPKREPLPTAPHRQASTPPHKVAAKKKPVAHKAKLPQPVKSHAKKPVRTQPSKAAKAAKKKTA